MSDDITPEERELYKKLINDLKVNKNLCTHCFLETHLRAFVEVMADEPDQYIKMSTIYHNLKTILGDDDE